MASFPRAVPSAHCSPPKVPTGLISVGRTGVSQLRSEVRQGRRWTETWGAIKAGNAAVETLRAFIEYHYNNLIITQVDHPYLPGSGGAPNGAGGGTPLVAGASQAGASLATDGWPNSTLVVAAGDNFTISGLTAMYQAYADGTSDGGGSLTFTINPPIASGNSPANNAALTLTGNRFRCYIADYEPGSANPGEYMVGMRVTFQETV